MRVIGYGEFEASHLDRGFVFGGPFRQRLDALGLLLI